MSRYHRTLSDAYDRAREIVLGASDVCHLCGKPGADTADHLDPMEAGGASSDPANLAPAHRACNSARGNKPVWQARIIEPTRDWF